MADLEAAVQFGKKIWGGVEPKCCQTLALPASSRLATPVFFRSARTNFRNKNDSTFLLESQEETKETATATEPNIQNNLESQKDDNFNSSTRQFRTQKDNLELKKTI